MDQRFTEHLRFFTFSGQGQDLKVSSALYVAGQEHRKIEELAVLQSTSKNALISSLTWAFFFSHITFSHGNYGSWILASASSPQGSYPSSGGLLSQAVPQSLSPTCLGPCGQHACTRPFFWTTRKAGSGLPQFVFVLSVPWVPMGMVHSKCWMKKQANE